MPRTRVQPALGIALVVTVGLHTLASCGIWVLLSVAPPCCPVHEAGAGVTIGTACCVSSSEDATATPTLGSVVKAPELRAVQSFWAEPPSTILNGGYTTTLPVAARGHTSVPLSALLI